MPIKVQEYEKYRLILMEGVVDIKEASQFLDWMKKGPCNRIVVDMKGVEEIDTSIIQILVAARFEAMECGGCLRVICPPPVLMKIFSQIGFGDELRIN